MLKGPFCFVFQNENSSSPLYAVNLVDMKTEHKGPVALLQTNLGDTLYEFTFGKDEDAKKFSKKAFALAQSGKADEVRKHLGHEHLLNHTKSIMFAQAIAEKKIDDQPSAPFGNEEVLAAVPIAAM